MGEDKKGAGPTSKEVETKKVTSNAPTSKQAFRNGEEEHLARFARQRKAEEEWVKKLLQKEQDRRRRIQKIASRTEEHKAALRANDAIKTVDIDAQRNIIRNLEAEQSHMRAELQQRVKATQRNQMLNRINEETECV